MSCLLWYDEDDNDSYKEKLEQLKKVSNPKEVIKNAQQYFNDPDIKVYLSKRKDKKYAIYDPNIKNWSILEISIMRTLRNIKMMKEDSII